MSYIDLQGMVFGYLKAIRYVGKGRWECQCLNCGKLKTVKGDHLRLGYISSCGCLKAEQETRGQRATNTYIIRTNKGNEILVDAEDLDKLSKHSWSVGADGYPQARVKGKMVRIHELLLGRYRGPGLVIDHINRNRLDNRKANLRIVTKSHNCANREAGVEHGRA